MNGKSILSGEATSWPARISKNLARVSIFDLAPNLACPTRAITRTDSQTTKKNHASRQHADTVKEKLTFVAEGSDAAFTLMLLNGRLDVLTSDAGVEGAMVAVG